MASTRDHILEQLYKEAVTKRLSRRGILARGMALGLSIPAIASVAAQAQDAASLQSRHAALKPQLMAPVLKSFRRLGQGRDLILLEHGKTLAGVTICEDLWQEGGPLTVARAASRMRTLRRWTATGSRRSAGAPTRTVAGR